MLYNLIFDILNYEKKVFESKEEKKVFEIHTIALNMMNQDFNSDKFIACDFDLKEMINHNLEIPRKTIIHIYYDGELSIFSIEEKNFLKEVGSVNIFV